VNFFIALPFLLSVLSLPSPLSLREIGSVEHVWRQDDSDDSDDEPEELPVVLEDEIVEKRENPLFKVRTKRL